MIAALMAYCLLASLLVAVMGRAFEEATRLVGLPTRWAWAGALALTLGLVAAAPYRAAVQPPIEASRVEAGEAVVGIEPERAERGPVESSPGVLVRMVFEPILRATLPLGTGFRSTALAGIWVILTLTLAGWGVALLLRSRRHRRGWPSALIVGERVRIAPAGGPAVAGLIRPEIVVPRWLTNAPEAEQWMAVFHEREHVRAGDPYLLAFGYLAVTLTPWNPVVWWMHRRLRLAVELDCDRRVLRRGVRPRTYGSFLIEVAELGRGPLAGAVTLAPSKPNLERRLTAMTASTPRYAAARAAVIAAFGALLLTTACDTRLPTSAEIEDMDVAAAESELDRIKVLQDVDVRYLVDGVEVSPAEARSLSADQIASINVMRGSDGDGSYGAASVNIVTKEAAAAALRDRTVEARRSDDLAHDSTRVREGAAGELRLRGNTSLAQTFEGLLLIDGVRTDADRLRDLHPDRIESIEVLKGRAAERLYSEPEAAHGVILITTRR